MNNKITVNETQHQRPYTSSQYTMPHHQLVRSLLEICIWNANISLNLAVNSLAKCFSNIAVYHVLGEVNFDQ